MTGPASDNTSSADDQTSPQVTTLIIFGATGDLTKRLLLPALGQLLGLEPDLNVRLIGVGRHDLTDDQWRDKVREAFADERSDAGDRVAEQTVYRRGDPTDADDLRSVLSDIDGRPVLYFAVPPSVTRKACEALRDVDLPPGTTLAPEKPFGSDQKSARELNELLLELVPENQIYRVDHFLGQSVLLDLLGVRLANRVFEPVWSGTHIESVVIRYDESLGLEGRAGYYDGVGALQDMIQSHLLQLVAVVAMEPPATLGERDLRDAIGAALRAVHIWDDDAVASSRRARYTAGEAGGEQLPNYVDEDGVDASNNTETLAEATFEVRTNRWQGVPFTLRSGKALDPEAKEIVLTFRPLRHVPEQFEDQVQPNVLRFTFGHDAMSVRLNVHRGSHPFALKTVDLDADFGNASMRAYAEVLSGIIKGDETLAVRGDAAEECWRIVDPIVDAWRANKVPIDDYAAGSAGPDAWPTLPL
ncbi:glucose-6-phosphate dehydrogenase [Gordonia sp. w5E2]|uniref:glucose-6-phosphate dehydrogenase n=1 Tax=Gordonia TaxID=2053 RepID=UPI0009FA9327|nr:MULTISPECIES: glucose-6-phosphate dehydrogenase [Gordonia]